MQPEKVAFDLKVGQSKPIYNAFKWITEFPLRDDHKRIVEGTIPKTSFL